MANIYGVVKKFDKLICKNKKNNISICGTFDRGSIDNVMMDTFLYIDDVYKFMDMYNFL